MLSPSESVLASTTTLESDTDHPIFRPQRPPPPPPPTQSEPSSPIKYEVTQSSTETIIESNKNVEDNNLSLLFEFNNLFDSFDYEIIRNKILSRQMTTCHFTTVLWRIFLHCLPRDSAHWNQAIDISRDNYTELIDSYLNIQKIRENNHDKNDSDHPLSPEENSIWNQTNRHKELKDNIYQDVIRTWQEISFFQQQYIRDLLLEVLYIHSRHYEQTLPYRQGMHEILAVIVYLIDSESKRVNEYSESNELMKKLYDPVYLAHDSYGIYEKMMGHLQQFYDFKPTIGIIRKNVHTLFQRPHDVQVQMNDTVMRVNSIFQRLKDYDCSLYNKLKDLNIEPMVYGIRWLRLLFGREIPFEFIPTLWTIIFCYDECFGFVNYFFPALLMEIGKLFKKNDESEYSFCLQYLMIPNVISDVENIIQKALDLEKITQNKYLQDSSSQLINNRSSTSEIPKPMSPVETFQNPLTKNNLTTRAMSQTLKSDPSKITNGSEMAVSPGKEMRQLLDENIQKQKYCVQFMNKFIDRLRKGVLNLQTPNEDEVLIQLTGLEQIANVLDGTLPFDENSLQVLVNYQHKENPIENGHNNSA